MSNVILASHSIPTYLSKKQNKFYTLWVPFHFLSDCNYGEVLLKFLFFELLKITVKIKTKYNTLKLYHILK